MFLDMCSDSKVVCMNIANAGSSYLNFVFGTGSECVSDAIKHAIKNRKANGVGFSRAVLDGASVGVKLSHHKSIKAGGFWSSLKSGFSEIPKGWTSGKGFGKIKGALKGCGKAMPALMASLMILGEIPNVIKAVKEKGVMQGVKEVGKTMVRLTAGAAFAAVGAAFVPYVGGMAGWMLGDYLATKIVGKSHTEKVMAQEEKLKAQAEAQKTDPMILAYSQAPKRNLDIYR